MRRDHDRCAGTVQFLEQPQQAAREGRVDVAGRLVGEQQLGPNDQRAGDGGALLLAPESTGGMTCIRSPKPTQRSSSATSAR